jgi:hypothetical protein
MTTRREFITLLGGAVQGGSHEFESSYAPRPPRVAAELRHDARRRSRRNLIGAAAERISIPADK